MTTATAPKEAVGERYQLELMQHAQQMTWQALQRIAAAMTPGMYESQARKLGMQILAEMNMQRIWHPLLIRFGANTLKTFKQRSEGDPQLAENDIFLVDMGVVWEGHEGDAGGNLCHR